jgi:hypothetical protein
MNNLPIIADLSRTEIVSANANHIRQWLAPLTIGNRIALLDVLRRAIEQADKAERDDARAELLKAPGCSFDAGNGRYEVSLVRARIQYEYPSAEHTALCRKISEYKAMLSDLEKGMREKGVAVAQNEQDYQVRLTENKLTIKPKGEK